MHAMLNFFLQYFPVIFINFSLQKTGTRFTHSFFLYFGQQWPWSVHQGVVQARVCVAPRHKSTHMISTVHVYELLKKYI